MQKERKRFLGLLALIVLLIAADIASPAYSQFVDTSLVQHLLRSGLVLTIALVLMQVLHLYIQKSRLRNVARTVIFLGAVIIIFFIFQDEFLAIGISLGIIAAVLTLIFQSVILNLVGWVYITTARIYGEDDRIRIGNIKGDIVDINPMNTKILEVGGEYVNPDLPSGKVYTVPNSMVLNESVANYTRYFPYVWIDIPFDLTYETDFPFVVEKVEKIVMDYLGPEIDEIEEKYHEFMNRFYAVGADFVPIAFNYTPQGSFVNFRVTFPLNPRLQSKVTTEVTQQILDMFNKYPGKVRFPVGRHR